MEKRQSELLQGVAGDLKDIADGRLDSLVAGRCLAAAVVKGPDDSAPARMGLCANMAQTGRCASPLPEGVSPAADMEEAFAPHAGRTAKETAALLLDGAPSPLEATAGMAALNALLPTPEDARPRKAQDVILERSRGRRVAVVGHFPFVEKMGDAFASLDVLEKRPRPGDLGEDKAPEILGRAEVAALTATSLLNGTFADLLSLTPEEACVILLGPSTPFAPSLFAAGVDIIAGCAVRDPEKALACVVSGAPFKHMVGLESLVWEK